MTIQLQTSGGTPATASPSEIAQIRTDLSVPSVAEANAAATAAVTAHTGAADPHPQYQTQAEGDARYVRTVNGQAPDGTGNVTVAGGGSGGSNLGTTRTSTTVTVTNDGGTAATLPAADGSNAGVMTAAQATAVAGIDGQIASLSSAINAKVQNSMTASTTVAPSATAAQTAIDAKVQNSLTASTTVAPSATAVNTALGLKADLASPALTGTPTAPTATAGTSTTQIATTAFVTAADNLKAPLASPALTGTPTAPTAAGGTNTTQIATTAFVTAAVASKANAASPSFTGVSTFAGANITTASAMAALAIDTAAALNTKSIAADSTFTFSATPAANTWFQVAITNTDTAPHIITFPSAFSQVTQGARTTCPIAASGRLNMVFRYNGTGYEVFGDGPFLNNFAATAAPGVGDDVADGYGPGSLWGDATGNALYWCESNAAGAAVWNAVTGGGGGSGTVTSVGLTAPAFLSVAGSPITTSGTLALSYSGTALPVANGGTGQTTAAAFATTLQGTGSAATDCGFRGMPQNSQSAAYTCVMADSGKHILHPSADTTARVFTIPANASVAFPVGTALTFINQNGGGVITIAITSDTMRLAGAGTTGSRSLAANGIATAVKVTTTEWLINGTGLS